MPDSLTTQTRNALRTWRIFFILAILQGLLAVVALLLSASEPGSRLFLGLSAARLVSIFVGLIVLATLTWLLLCSWIKPKWTLCQLRRLAALRDHPRRWSCYLLLSGFMIFGGIFIITLTPELREPFTQALFARLLPFVIWFTGLSTQVMIVLLIIRYQHAPAEQRASARPLLAPLALIAGVFLLWTWVARNTLASESLVVGWNETGVPILETQVLAAWLLGMIFLPVILLANRDGKPLAGVLTKRPWAIDLAFVLLIWLASAWLWNSVAVSPSWFVSEPRPPNHEPYPNSDALSYDMTAQQLLVGEGLQFAGYPFIRRPVHAVYLTLLHGLAGQSYPRVITWQILILAWIPAMIYLIARRLHTQFTGVIAAALVALREANAISLAGTITSSHSKSLMADLPAMLAVVCFVYVVIFWLDQSGTNPILGLLSGGLLGIAGLIRPELLALYLGVALILVFISITPARRWLGRLGFFSLGLVLVMAPWIYRNWALTGQIYLDNPTFRLEWIEERYQTEPVGVPELGGPAGVESSTQQPTELVIQTPAALPTTAALAVAASTATPEAPPPQTAMRAALGDIAALMGKNFPGLLQSSLSHFSNSFIQVFLVLPSTFRPLDSLVSYAAHRDADQLWVECCSALAYVRRLPYWHKWDGKFPSQALVPLAFSIMLIALGIARSWNHRRWVGLLPAVLALVHITINALVRNSGGRYILPLDWVGLLYFSIGLAAVTLWLIQALTGRSIAERLFLTPRPVLSESRPRSPWRSPVFYAVAAALLLAGAAAPILESAVPARYTAARQEQMLAGLLSSSLLTCDDRAALQTVINQDGVVLAGSGLYPRFYRSGEGEPGTNNPFSSAPYRRVGFYLAGPISSAVVLPDQRQPDFFPNGADVLLIGCPTGEPLVVAIFDQSFTPAAVLLQPGSPASIACPTD